MPERSDASEYIKEWYKSSVTLQYINEGCLLEVFIMRLFDQTLSIHAHLFTGLKETCLGGHVLHKLDI